MIIWDSGAFLVGLEFIMENVKSTPLVDSVLIT